MPCKAILVSAAYSAYFPLLRDLVVSFHQVGGSYAYDLGVLDLGLQDNEVAWLQSQGVVRIVRPDWPFAGLEAQPEWYKAMVCRPFLPAYFPEWDTLVWSDADAWMQTRDALDLAENGVREDGFAVVPMVDHGYWPPGQSKATADSAAWQMASIQDGFGAEAAQALLHFPLIFASFLAGNRNAPHWQVWGANLAKALHRKIYFSAEQAALTMTVHTSGLRTHLLPNSCHWACHVGIPGFDSKSRTFVHPFVPHHALSMLALPANTKTNPILVRTLDGRTISRSPRYRMASRPAPTGVAIQGHQHSVDGICSIRFRQTVFDLLSVDATVRFLQIGAMDGKAFDPLHESIRRHRWQGILVEPIPEMMRRLKANYAGFQGLEFAELAIAEESGRRSMARIRDDAVVAGRVPNWAAGLSTLLPERTAISGRAITEEQFSALRNEVEQIEVDCVSFSDFAKRYPLDGTEVLQIDAEGYDFRILSQIDLAVFRPRTIQLEIVNLLPNEISGAIDQLQRGNYQCFVVEDGQDLFAVRRDFLIAEGFES